MATFRVKSLGALHPLIKRHAKQRQDRIKKAVRRAAQKGAQHVRRNVPVAFSELRDSVQAKTSGTGHCRILADAPHAAPVETGSRPHWPPLEPLIAWVKLRGFQGLASPKKQRRLPGTTTIGHAQSVAGSIAGLERDGAVPIDAAEQVARAIQVAISKRGTKPHWYMRGAVPVVTGFLDVEIRKALPDRAGAR
jgi:hypothetical protein